MKRISIFAFFIVLLFVSQTEAGTLMLGFKGWYTEHEAWNLEYVRHAVESQIQANSPGTFDTGSEGSSSNGFLGGALIGYQTDDREWAFSFAYMFYSKFSADVSAWGNYTSFPYMRLVDVAFDIEEERRDIDSAITYSFSDFIKFFLGYKFIQYKDTINYSVDINQTYISLSDYSSRYESETIIHMPTAGIGFVFPLNSYIIVGAQFGILYIAAGEAEVSQPSTGESDSDDIKRNFGYNIELTTSLVFGDSLVLQIGYRYQQFKIQGTSSDTMLDSKDVNKGITFSAVYLINI